MAELPGAGRLDPETLAAFIDGLLPPEERAKVQAEIAADPETYEWVVNAVNAVEDASVVTPVTEHGPVTATADEPHHAGEVHRTAGPRRADDPRAGGGGSDRRVLPFTRRRAFMGALGALAAAAVVILAVQTQPAWWQRLTGPQADPRFAKLVEAVGEERYIEARLTGGFKYGPMRQVMRGPGDLSQQNLALLAAAGELQKAARFDPSPEHLHHWGVAQILTAQYDGAVETLADAAMERPASYNILSDLAAAYAARAAVMSKGEDWPRALETAERAIALDASRPEAHYARALALTELSLVSAAIDAWNTYRALERDPGWLAEADRKLAALSRPPVSRRLELEPLNLRDVRRRGIDQLVAESSQRVRRFLEETLPAEWARAVLARDVSAARELAREGVTMARSYQSLVGDQFPSAVFALLSASLDPPAVPGDLARAVDEFVTAVGQFERNRPDSGRAPLLRAMGYLGGSNHPLSVYADVLLAELHAYDGQLEREAVLLDASITEASMRSYIAVAARAHNRRALSRFRQGDLEGSLRHRLASPGLYSRLRDLERVTALHATVSENYRDLRDYTQAWSHGIVALKASLGAKRLGSRHLALLQGAQTAAARALHFTSLRLIEALVEQGEEAGNPSDAVIGYLNRARSHVALGLGRRAQEDLRLAELWIRRFDDESFRLRNRIELTFAAGLVAEVSGEANARNSIDLAITELGRGGYATRIPRLLRARARLLSGAGDVAGALADLEVAAVQLEQQRSRLATKELRLLQTDELRLVRAEQAQLAFRTGDLDGAVRFADLGRAQTIVEAMAAAQRAQYLGDETGVPAGTTVLHLTATDPPLALVAGPAGRRAFELQCGLGVLAAKVRAVRRLVRLESEDGRLRLVLSELYRCIVAPAEPYLTTTSLTVIPDGIFSELPFSALYDGRSYLCERFELRLAPSLRWLAHTPATSVDSRSDATVFADPDFDQERYPSTQRLPWARREAAGLVRQYRAASVLSGPDATGAAFLAQLRRPGILHFAGHTVDDAGEPLSVTLLTAPDDKGDAGVSGFEILQVTGAKADAVILASCSPPRAGTGGRGCHRDCEAISRHRRTFGGGHPVASCRRVDE